MTVIKTETLTPDVQRQLSEADSHQIYCGLDTCVTFEVFEELSNVMGASPEDDSSYPLIYNFERSMQAPALDMMLRGFKIDDYERHKGIAQTREELRVIREQLDELASSVWDMGLNPGSHKQLKEFFYQRLRLPEQYINQKGVRKLSLNREVLEKLDVYLYARPFISLILEARDLAKRLQVLETEVSFDERMRTSYNIGGTNTGRWCLDGNSEVLTKSGWISLEKWEDSQDIAVWSPDGKISFAPAKKVSFDNDKELLSVENNRISLLATAEHRQPFFSTKGNLNVALIGEKRNLHLVPLAGKLTASFEEHNKTRICVMTQADGSIIHSRLIRFHFKRERKIKRCEELLVAGNIPYKKSAGLDASTYIYIYDPPQWMINAKYFGPWLLQHDPTEVLREIVHWDGTPGGPWGTVYYSSIKTNAEWIKTMAHIGGKYGALTVKITQWGPQYRVFFGKENTTRILKEHYKSGPVTDKVFCAKTHTGFFLVRRNGLITVTGNSSSSDVMGVGTNLQNITPELRRMFIADEGWKLCGIDLEQAESREVGWLCGLLFGDWSYLNACEGGDLHTTTAKLIWPELGWTGDSKEDREIAERQFYREFSYRDMSKRGGHATNYLVTPFTMSRHLKIPVSIAETFQDSYFGAYPCIPRWQQWTGEQLQRYGELTTPFGRTRQFFGRPDDDTTLRKAIAYSPQSSTGDRLNLGLWRIWHHMPNVQLLAQVHDAVYFQYRECSHEEERAIVEKALELVRVSQWHEKHHFVIPGEAKIGWNWASMDTGEKFNKEGKQRWKFDDGNPDGLIKFNVKLADARKRNPTGKERRLS